MAFFNKTKAAGKNFVNRIGQTIDTSSYETKISAQRATKNKLITDVGVMMYEIYIAGKKQPTQEVYDALAQIQECDAEIDRLTAEKEQNIALREEERRDNMEAAYAADVQVEVERAERKAEREAEKEAQREQEKEKIQVSETIQSKPEQKPAAKKTAEKKPATKKTAEKKPATKKTAAKKQ